ncbi:MAG: DUF1788 domain-containing protein [Collinsella intestinalis]
MEQQGKSPAQAFAELRARLQDPEFLAGHGLGNEVPFFILPYAAALEDEVREQVEALVRDFAPTVQDGAPVPQDSPTAGDTRVIHFDLWDVFLQICQERRILEKIPALEERRGTDGLLRRMEKIATPEAFLKVMSERYEELGGQMPGRDVVLISGVGKVYPLVRAHNILENAQPVFTEVPMVMLYPGVYDGQQLHLFGKISDGNYYRAFSLL